MTTGAELLNMGCFCNITTSLCNKSQIKTLSFYSFISAGKRLTAALPTAAVVL
jgi:hypothetical protein